MDQNLKTKNGNGSGPNSSFLIPPSSLSLDELIALNDEIAALVRAGVPLEAGLAELGSDMPGRLGQFALALSERTARGESLGDAIMDDAGDLPAAYRAVVQAGMRAGRLPAALEAVAAAARRLSETHRAAVSAALYPLIVVLAAWCGLLFFTNTLAPQLAATFRAFNVPGHQFFDAMGWVGRGAWYWGPIVPVTVVLLAIFWWLASTRASALQGSRADALLGRIPWMGQMLRWSRTATFLEVLALLIENETPLSEAIILAAEASGDPQTLQSVQTLALSLENGLTQPKSGTPIFPPLLNWLLLAASRDDALLPALQHAAATYHRRARHQSDLLRLFLPILLTITFAGSVTALYALTLFAPYASMLRAMGG